MDKKTKKEDIEKWVLFILSFEGTYTDEDQEKLDIVPWVYLIPKSDVKNARRYAKKAKKQYLLHANDELFDDLYVTDYFMELLDENDVMYDIVGVIAVDLFVERKIDYLEKTIKMEVV